MTHYIRKDLQKTDPMVGDGLLPDGWKIAEGIKESDGFKDSGFPGCMFRIPCKGYKIAVNIITTGHPSFNGNCFQSRCKIEFVGDCEPSIFSGGILYHHASNPR